MVFIADLAFVNQCLAAAVVAVRVHRKPALPYFRRGMLESMRILGQAPHFLLSSHPKKHSSCKIAPHAFASMLAQVQLRVKKCHKVMAYHPKRPPSSHPPPQRFLPPSPPQTLKPAIAARLVRRRLRLVSSRGLWTRGPCLWLCCAWCSR